VVGKEHGGQRVEGHWAASRRSTIREPS
jgi:hypothetical protein